MSGARAALALVLVAASACGGGGAGEGAAGAASDPAQGERAVVGTVLDAATGAPVEGAEVRGPAGARARSDAAGRFRLPPLPATAAGELVAEAADGRRAILTLRPAGHGAPGHLEVVLHLRHP